MFFLITMSAYASEISAENIKLNNIQLQAQSIDKKNVNSGAETPDSGEIPVPIKKKKKLSPGKIPSFWWAFVLSAIGSYTIYGIAAGPISVLVVYLSSKASKVEVRKAIWGWITGTILGLGIWALVKLI